LGDRTIKAGAEVGELRAIQEYGLLENLGSFITVNNDLGKAVDNQPPCKICGGPIRGHVGKGHGYVHGAGWLSFYGKIERVVPVANFNGRFNPAFINLDTTHFPTKASLLAGRIGRFCPPGTFMALNIIAGFMSRKASEEEISKSLLGYRFERVKFHDTVIQYKNGACNLVTRFLEF
jgi:hypothetical protein